MHGGEALQLMGNKLMSLMANNKGCNLPVVAILGATGTGKSKLAIELAKKFNGEIISADSMQVYRGLDIITNKVTAEEQQLAVHYFINCVDPLARFTVVDFRNRALPVISGLLKKNKLPIIVGGTNYYIESLLWDVLVKPEVIENDKLLYEVDKNEDSIDITYSAAESINKSPHDSMTPDSSDTDEKTGTDGDSSTKDDQANIEKVFEQKITSNSCDKISSHVLHKLLSEIDPAMASTLHPNDKRKVIRSLQVYQQNQCRHSEILSLQRSQKGGCVLGGPLRYKNSIMLWIQCDKPVLDKRLDERVNKMIENGLIDELLEFHSAYNKQRLLENPNANYTEGIFQSIGFKEFHEYLILSKDERMSEKGRKMCNEAIEAVKIRTRKYSTKQKRWIRNRFLRNPDRDLPPVYGLNGSDLSRWKEDVYDIASDIVMSALQGKVPSVSALPVESGFEYIPETHYCDVCEKVLIGRATWETHIISKPHQRRKQSMKKKRVL